MFKMFKQAEEKKLVAVIGQRGCGIFFKNADKEHESVFVNSNGLAFVGHPSLKRLLSDDNTRKPIYEGDSVVSDFPTESK